jgi:Mn-dependent DtxR family transcriptional regulator
VRRWVALLLALQFLAGCAGLNDALVRAWFLDHHLSDRVNSQIREGLERRMSAPAEVLPKKPAPAFLDQG